MKYIHSNGKTFRSADFENLIIGGQNEADTICFVVQKIFQGLDLSSWSWYLQFTNKEGCGDTVFLHSSISTECISNLHVEWTPSQTATQVPGKLLLQLYAVKKEGENVRRFVFSPVPVYISEWLNPEPITQALPTVIEQAVELMTEYLAQLNDAIQAGEDAKKAANDAEAAAQNASSSADTARDAAETAQRLKENFEKEYTASIKDLETAKNEILDIIEDAKNSGLTELAEKTESLIEELSSWYDLLAGPDGLKEEITQIKTDAETAMNISLQAKNEASLFASAAETSAAVSSQKKEEAEGLRDETLSIKEETQELVTQVLGIAQTSFYLPVVVEGKIVGMALSISKGNLFMKKVELS